MIQRIMSMGYGGVRPVHVNPSSNQDFGTPFFYSTASDPVYRIHCNKESYGCPVEGRRIHIPAAALPSDGSDAGMAVIDQSSGREFDFWRVQTSPLPRHGGRVVIGWGGVSRLHTWGAGAAFSCASAACTPLLDTVIRYPELSSGSVNHALHLVVNCSNGRTVYPASRQGGGGTCSDTANAPATGQWLQLAMSQRSISALHVPAWEKGVYFALARYGGIVGDEGSTGGFDVEIESPRSYTSFGMPNPFVAWAATLRTRPRSNIEAYVADGSQRYALRLGSGINWTRQLRVIDPCVISGTC